MIVNTTKHSITVNRQETGFDKACDMAYKMALNIFGTDDDGDLTGVPDSDRSTDTIVVEFKSYKHTGNMGGQEHTYTFETWIERHNEE